MAARMEKLESWRYSDTENDAAIDAVMLAIELPGACRNIVSDTTLEYVQNKWPQLPAAADALKKAKQSLKNISWDLHSDNVMLRGNVPVFTDPWVTGPRAAPLSHTTFLDS
jgi:hypothetical protein